MTSGRALVLGAYGAVGREVVRLLAASSGVEVTASGRRAQPLEALGAELGVQTRLLDASRAEQLVDAIGGGDVVINCVGPYLEHGLAIATACVTAGAHYVDVASEQEHFRRLRGLHSRAMSANVSLVCAAGLYPGISGVLAESMLAEVKSSAEVELTLAMGICPEPTVGAAQLASGLLDLSHPLEVLSQGRLIPFALGQRPWARQFPPPFGVVEVMPWPQLEVLRFGADTRVAGCRTGLWMLGLRRSPGALLRFARWLDPASHPLVFRAILRGLEKRQRKAAQSKRATELGLRAALRVSVDDGDGRRCAVVSVLDGLESTAYLPVMLVHALIAGTVPPGLQTGGQVVRLSALVEAAERHGWDLQVEFPPTADPKHA